MLTIVLYLFVGVFVLNGAITIHISKAERIYGGVVLEYWINCYKEQFKYLGAVVFSLMQLGGLLVWPLQIIILILSKKAMYNAYNLMKTFK